MALKCLWTLGLYRCLIPEKWVLVVRKACLTLTSDLREASALCQLSQQHGEEAPCCCWSLSDWPISGPRQSLVHLTHPHPLLFLCHPSGVPVVHFLVLPGLTAVSLCLDGCSSFLTIMKEALARFSLAWLPCFPNCRTLNRPTATHLERLKPWLWISTRHISFDSLMGRIIYSCFNLCFTYWWLWSSFPCLCLEQMLDLLGFERSGVSVIFRRDTLCHFHIDF